MSDTPPRILYCHCQYAQVVPKEVKEAVLRKLCESGVAFEAVADLCEMAARRDPALQAARRRWRGEDRRLFSARGERPLPSSQAPIFRPSGRRC